MKKLFKYKMLTTGIIATMIGVTILLAGLTLAWFTSSGSNGENIITLGKLEVTASLINHNAIVGVHAQPGLDIPDQVGWVQNLSSIPALAKLNFEVLISKAGEDWWVDAEELGLVDIEWQFYGSNWAVDENNSPITVHPMGNWFHANGENFYMWGIHNDDIYVGMQGNDRLHYAYTLTPKGSMSNDYQGADIQVKIHWEATQLWADGAIEDTFGIGFFDIDWFADLNDVFLPDLIVFSAPINGPNYAARYANYVGRLPASSFKTYLTNLLGL